MRDWGRLLRLSLLPTAAADVACGLVLGHRGAWPPGIGPWFLLLASMAVYAGSMALNDWADRHKDRQTRPERPLPSGAIVPAAALGAALGLQALGLAFAVPARATLWVALIACLASGYNLIGRGPWTGPLLLALCRALNMALGLVYAQAHGIRPDAMAWFVPCYYGLYVFLISRLGRLEDGEDQDDEGWFARAYLGGAALVFCLPVLVSLGGGMSAVRLIALLLAGAAASRLVRLALRRLEEPVQVPEAMGAALRLLLVFTAVTALLASGPASLPCAVLILGCYPLSIWLRGVFPPS
jgi:4-hydroxybenzoate polyprenyltransferase